MCAGLVSSTYSIPSTTFIVATPLVSTGWALLRAHAAGCSALRYRPRGSPITMSMYFASYDGSNKKVFWQEMWRHELEEALRHDPVVIVPVGSVEQHGPHCPPDVDISIPFHLAVAAAQAVDDFPVLVAPPVSYGFTHYNLGFLGTITLSLETFIAMLCDICRSLKANGFERIVLVNGHGGNVAPQRAASVKLSEEDVWALPLVYWQLVEDELREWSETDEGSIGHGGEWETSLQLHLRPHLIDRS